MIKYCSSELLLEGPAASVATVVGLTLSKANSDGFDQQIHQQTVTKHMGCIDEFGNCGFDSQVEDIFTIHLESHTGQLRAFKSFIIFLWQST